MILILNDQFDYQLEVFVRFFVVMAIWPFMAIWQFMAISQFLPFFALK